MVISVPESAMWSSEDIRLPFGGASHRVSGRSTRWPGNGNYGSNVYLSRQSDSSMSITSNSPGRRRHEFTSDYSSTSSLESASTRETSVTRETTVFGEKSATTRDSNDTAMTQGVRDWSVGWRSKFAKDSKQQSPTIKILNIKLDGPKISNKNIKEGTETIPEAVKTYDVKSENVPLNITQKKTTIRPKEVEKLTSEVDVQMKRKRFEVTDENDNVAKDTSIDKRPLNDSEKGPEPPPRRKNVKENWECIREKHCPITASLVNDGKGDSLRSSILCPGNKLSFYNLKFSKATSVVVGGEEVKLKEVTSTKAFEDRATSILNEMRKQRRSLQMEYVAKVSQPSAKKKTTGWRDKLSRSESIKNDNKEKKKGDKLSDKEGISAPTNFHSNLKRNSITKLAGKLIRKLSFGKADDNSNSTTSPTTASDQINVDIRESNKRDEPTPQAQFNNPLDFILMKEEYIRKNPPKKEYVRERSVESDCGEPSMATVMDQLKKLVKRINPKREFPSDIAKREQEEKRKKEEEEKEKKKLRDEILAKSRPNTWNCGYTSSWEVRMRKYQGASLTPFNKYAARWNSCQDLRSTDEYKVVDKKAVRERIQNKVLSSVHQAVQDKLEDTFIQADLEDFSLKGLRNLQAVKHKGPRRSMLCQEVMVLEAVEYRKRELTDIIAHFNKDKERVMKKRVAHVKPVLHGQRDLKERFAFALVTRTNNPWETVKPINVAVKKKTEIFSPKSSLLLPGKAKVSVVGSRHVATVTSPGTCGTTAYCEQHKWDHLRGCALYTVAGKESGTKWDTVITNQDLVVNLAVENVLENNVSDSDHIFTKCERKPQSQLVKDIVTWATGSLSRISFHYPPTFTYFDTVITVTRFLRTKKNIKKYKWKEEEVIARVIEGKTNDRRESNPADNSDVPFLSYGTV